MTLKDDIETYQAAKRQRESLYAEIGKDRNKAIERRSERWQNMARQKECAENVIFSLLGQKERSLKDLGLYSLFQELAGGSDCFLLFKIVDNLEV